MTSSDITKIPEVMEKNGWPVGAKLMKKWFSGKSNNVPSAGIHSLTDVQLNWILSFNRARKVFRGMIDDRVWTNEPAKQEIIATLRRNGLLNYYPQRIGNPSLPIFQQDRDYIQFRKVGGTVDTMLGPMDDLRAALANFVFRVLVYGTVEPILNGQKLPTGSYKVKISSACVYALDSYDFNDTPGENQPLGNWDFSDDSVGRTTLNGGTDIHNSDFRDWRSKNNMGGDYLVFSDMICIKENFEFTFKK